MSEDAAAALKAAAVAERSAAACCDGRLSLTGCLQHGAKCGEDTPL